ncbi:ferritin-like domain-containing protein [Caldimonas sp. KR1-144]|uniref:ferritin-like domain-containing protein n=1 Tax=Caldimonas sp. KR1-144 TaxID=3400911 RepID=UPI003C0DDB58
MAGDIRYTNVWPLPAADPEALQLDLPAIEATRHSLARGAITLHDSPMRTSIVRLLNDALATELVCMLRYKRHHFTAHGLASPKIADEFLIHARDESRHADRLAQRITQLGGEPDFSPETLSRRSHADYDDALGLEEMIWADLVAERVAIECYSQLITLIGERDPTTRRLIEDILADEQQHANELKDWLTG